MNCNVNIKMFSGVCMTAEVFLYINSMVLIIFSGMPYARRIKNILFMSTESMAVFCGFLFPR